MPQTISGHRVDGNVTSYRLRTVERTITMERGWYGEIMRSFADDWQITFAGTRLDLRPPDEPYVLDSYERRIARAGGGWSDHNGYAVDFRYGTVLHPDNQEHMTRAENEAVRGLLIRYRDALWWGGPTASASRANPGRSRGRYNHLIDEMHVFIGEGVSESYCKSVLGSLTPLKGAIANRPPVVVVPKSKLLIGDTDMVCLDPQVGYIWIVDRTYKRLSKADAILWAKRNGQKGVIEKIPHTWVNQHLTEVR